jgi:two-component system, sensor histidine kinase and response regulator
MPIICDTTNAEMNDAPRTVLVVEDNLVNQRVSAAMLKRLGFAVELANNGEEGVSKWEQGQYVAIIMDCQMPVLDGYSATARIRQQEQDQQRDRRMPIIALTANTLEEDRQRCFDSGMDDYLTKPVDVQVLGYTLNQWIEPAA